MGALALEGAIGIERVGSTPASRHPDVLGALEVSSFALMHSNQQRCVRDRTIFVMVDPTFYDTMCDGLARPELLWSTRRYRQGRREANKGSEEPSIDPARAF